jgi:hypothetical protein
MPKLTICRWSSDSLNAWPDLIASETRLLSHQRTSLRIRMAELKDALSLVNKELAITERLETRCRQPRRSAAPATPKAIWD